MCFVWGSTEMDTDPRVGGFRSGLRRASSFLLTPSVPTSDLVDCLEWEMSMARYHAATSTSLAIFFAVVYNVMYAPTEWDSLQHNIYLYSNITAALQQNISTSYSSSESWRGGGGEGYSDPTLISNIIWFYYYRLTSRVLLIFLMSGIIGTFVSSRICISDRVYHSIFQEYIFKELRGLQNHDITHGTSLLRRLFTSNVDQSFFRAELHSNEATFSIFGREFKRSAMLPYILCISNPIIFVCVAIPDYGMRFAFPTLRQPPHFTFTLQNASCLLILYNERIRRGARVPMLFRECMNVCTCRLILPRCLVRKLYDPECLHLIEEVDSIFEDFPVEQRVYLHMTIVCNSSMCIFTLGFMCLMLFLQNAFVSELVVCSWFSIPFSQKQALPNDSHYSLFQNYRELTNWEYIINDHFLFLLFFAVLLTCSNLTMFMVLAPTFIVMAAGIYSNDGLYVHMSAIDPWFIISLVVSYLLSFITNALTYRDVCEMFSNRASDSTYVRDNTMLEISHEFLSLSHIVRVAMHDCCEHPSITPGADHIRCMMWLLQKQRLEVQSLRHVGLEALGSRNRRSASDLPLWKLLRNEFKPGQCKYTGECFASVCSMSRCEVEFKLLFDDNVDATVRSEESELRHFLCSFMFCVLINASKCFPEGSLRLFVAVNICRSSALCSQLTTRPSHQLSPRHRSLALAVSGHQVHPASSVDADTRYVQVVVEQSFCSSDVAFVPVPASDKLQWIASFADLVNVAVLDYITRMHGYMHISPSVSFTSVGCIGAFALPCSTRVGIVDTSTQDRSFIVTPTVDALAQLLPASTTPLQILMVEDQNIIAMRFKRDLKESPLTAHYVVDHAPNVAQALLMLRNRAQPVPGQTGSDGAKAAYHVVLLDNQMPMTDGGSIDEDAGVKASFMLREVESEKGLPKSVMVGITSASQYEQELFLDKCQGNVWTCFQRDQNWSDDWDKSVRAEIEKHQRSSIA